MPGSPHHAVTIFLAGHFFTSSPNRSSALAIPLGKAQPEMLRRIEAIVPGQQHSVLGRGSGCWPILSTVHREPG